MQRSPHEDLILELYAAKVIEIGSFTLRSGEQSPIYVDLRRLVSYPDLLVRCANLMKPKIQAAEKNFGVELLCGVPLGGIPFTICLSTITKIPAILLRNDEKTHGKRNKIEGVFSEGQRCLVVEDVITTGGSTISTKNQLSVDHKLNPVFAVCFFTYLSPKECKAKNFDSVINIYDVVMTLMRAGKMERDIALSFYKKFEFDTRFKDKSLKRIIENTIWKRLQDRKEKSRICLSLDLTSTSEIIQMIRSIGSYISILKIHSDIITDFDEKFIPELKWWKKHYDFLIMEDRKFCDIGNTVVHQLQGRTKIVEWADLVTVHGIAGAGTIEAIRKVRSDIGIVLVAEMSSKDNLIDDSYTSNVIRLAEQFPDNVVGFVAQRKLTGNSKHYTFTPGVSLDAQEDSLGQTYSHPERVMAAGADFLIVGRDIYTNPEPEKRILEYKRF